MSALIGCLAGLFLTASYYSLFLAARIVVIFVVAHPELTFFGVLLFIFIVWLQEESNGVVAYRPRPFRLPY